MAAPSIIGAEAPWNGLPFGALVESCLRERGLTNSAYASTDTAYTSATTQQVAQAKTCVQQALTHLQELREGWFPMSEADCTASSDFTRVLMPLDFGSFGKGGAYIAGVQLKLLNPEEYAANVRPDADGGGVLCADVAGDPSHARLVMVQNTETAIIYYRWALDVFPRQTAAWTAHVLYKATAKALSADTDVVRVPVRLHLILEDMVRGLWRRKSGDARGAAEFWQLAMDALQDVEEAPGDRLVQRATSTLPAENTQRR